MGLAENVAASKHALDLLACREMDTDLFWLKLKQHVDAIVSQRCPGQTPSVDEDGPMDDAEAIRFEALTMPWGKHVGVQVGVVPIGYLIAITESKFGRRLERYLKSKRFAQRQEDESDERS